CVKWVARSTNDTSTGFFDSGACVLFQRPPESVVRRDEIPGIQAEADHRRRHSGSVRIGIVCPMKSRMSTVFSSQIAAAAGYGYRDPIARDGKLLHGQGDHGIRHIDNHADMLVIEPMCRDG